MGALACSVSIEALVSLDAMHVAGCAAMALYLVGLHRCLVSALASPLLATRLPETAIAKWRSENKGIWLVATIKTLIELSRLAEHPGKDIQEVETWALTCHRLAYVSVCIFWVELLTAIIRMVGAVEHRVQQLQDALSCKAGDFLEQVHKPCADLVNDTGPQLAPLGFPLLWFTMMLMRCGFEMYRLVRLGVLSPSTILSNPGLMRLMLLGAAAGIDFVVVGFTIAVGPFRLSAALDELSERLNELRCNAPEMHGQVQAVEAMLQRANKGRGWGIKVGSNLVMDRDVFQSACVKVALLTTAVVTFLDSKMGFDETEAKISGEHVDISEIRRMLTTLANATM